MAEIVLRGKSAPGQLTVDEVRLTGKGKGQILAVGADGTDWGVKVTWPTFALLKIPTISVAKTLKYVGSQFEEDPTDLDWDAVANRVVTVYRYRQWTLRWAALPPSVKNRLVTNNGMLTIKAGAYTGPFDYLWSGVKIYFRNLKTGLDETDEL